MDALSRWTFWALQVLLATTTYVQIVGKHIEMMSGLDRLQNLNSTDTFSAAPHGCNGTCSGTAEYVQIGGTVAVFLLFGWKIGILFHNRRAHFCILCWRVAKGHAAQMLGDLAKRAHGEEPG